MSKAILERERSHQSSSRLWFVESLRNLLTKEVAAEVLRDAEELISRSGNNAPQVTPGLFALRLPNPRSKSNFNKRDNFRSQDLRVEIRVNVFSDETYTKIAAFVAASAMTYARLLVNYVPNELRDMFKKGGAEIEVAHLTDLVFNVEGKSIATLSVEAIAALLVLIVELEREPNALFLLHGISFSDFMQHCREARGKLSRDRFLNSKEKVSANELVSAERIFEKSSFWLAKSDINRFSYDIRADELPAAILKRLDSLPLAGLEDEIDQALEEAYIQIARRAQGYGLGANY